MATALRLAAVLASALVALGFAAFATDEAQRGSSAQVQRLEEADGAAPTPAREQAREARQGAAREALEDANDILLAPFDGLVSARNPWVRRLVPTALALAIYGLGLMLLANYLPKARRPDRDWRTA